MKRNFKPRDPARIERICGLLEAMWKRYPQLRLGQLLANAIPVFDSSEVFYCEDDIVERALLRGDIHARFKTDGETSDV